jgi:hypothetical protein
MGAKLYTKQLYELPVHYWSRVDRFRSPDTIVLVDSYRFAKLYFRLPGLSWNHRPTLEEIRGLEAGWHGWFGLKSAARSGERLDLVKELCALEGVMFAAYGDRGYPEPTVRIIALDGAGLITRRAENGRKLYRYQVTEGRDPLGYADSSAAKALLDGQFHTADQWLAATIETEHPDLVAQLPEMFDSPRAGDLCLFAKPGWDFGDGNRGGHGGLTRDETIVPMIFAGPGLPRGARLPYARTVSLTPTIVEHIRGERSPEIFHRFDDDSLLDKLRAPGQNGPSNN